MLSLLPATLLALWWSALLWTWVRAWPRPFDDWKNGLFYLGASLLVCRALWQRARVSLRWDVWHGVIGLYATVALLPLVWRSGPWYEGLLEAARCWLWIGLAWAFAQWSSAAQWRVAAWSVANVAMIAALSAVHAYLLPIWSAQREVFLWPIGHVSYYGDLMAMHLPLAGYGLWRATRRWKVWWGAACVTLLFGVLFSGNRTSFTGLCLAVVAALACCWWRWPAARRRVLRWSVAACLFGAVLLIWHPPSVRGHAESVVSRMTRMFVPPPHADWRGLLDDVTSNRWHTYETTTNIIAARPLLGWGIGSFRFVYPEFAHRRDPDYLSNATTWYMHPHQEWLHQAMEVGLIGLSCFCLWWGMLLWRGCRSLTRVTTAAETAALLAGLLGCGLVIWSWLWSTNYAYPLSRLLAAFCVVLVWRGHRATVEATVVGAWRWWRPMALIITLSASVLLMAHHASLYAVQRAIHASTEATRLVWARTAHRLAPGAFDPLYLYASVLTHHDAAAPTIALWESVLRQYPYVPVVLYEAALAHLQHGDPESAIQLLRHAVANSPAFTPAETLLQELEGEEKR
ncbi:MAG: O-antigen ligase family protein [Deltaproteobacteria bacterium]|nr:O-antigen ligase family protein [Deltaproteobacteria bacterium]